QEPCIDSPEGQLAFGRSSRRSRDVLKEPFDLGPREISVQDQPGFLEEKPGLPLSIQLVAAMGRPAALPNDGPVDGFTGLSVPEDRGLPLIGDADARDLGPLSTRGPQGPSARFLDRGPYLLGVMLNPAGFREILGEFLVGAADYLARMVEQVGPGASGALVDSHD